MDTGNISEVSDCITAVDGTKAHLFQSKVLWIVLESWITSRSRSGTSIHGRATAPPNDCRWDYTSPYPPLLDVSEDTPTLQMQFTVLEHMLSLHVPEQTHAQRNSCRDTNTQRQVDAVLMSTAGFWKGEWNGCCSSHHLDLQPASLSHQSAELTLILWPAVVFQMNSRPNLMMKQPQLCKQWEENIKISVRPHFDWMLNGTWCKTWIKYILKNVPSIKVLFTSIE